MPTRRYKRAKKGSTRRGGFLPLLIAAVPAIPATIASAVQAAKAAKEMRGKGMRRYKKKRLGHGLSVMKIHSLNSVAGGRLAPPGYHRAIHPGRGLLAPAGAGMRRHVRKGHFRYIKKAGRGGALKRVHVRAHRVGGYVPYH